MPKMDLRLEQDGTPSDAAMRRCLCLLAQRGARLFAGTGGATVHLQRKDSEIAVAWIDGADVAAMDACGWLTGIDGGAHILAPTGRAIVRLMKSAPSPADAGANAEAAVLPPLPQPSPRRTETEGPLAWLRAHKDRDGKAYLSEEGYQAGLRLRDDFERAGIRPRVTADWDAIARTKDETRGMAGLVRDKGGGAAAAHQRFTRAVSSLPAEMARLLIDICCFELRLQAIERAKGMPKGSAHFMLGVGLTHLARHYGLLPPEDVDWRPRPHTRSWGADGYRPSIDGA